ncbi:acetyltransferase-like isoleucine patch superfamily enzyme [Planomicrobium koreense]|uniref:Acetyltransferase-like isoleucine patch superfamily enzyme n=1 Tax=Planococcus koreensis TaxID=112331 RepID=A0A7W8CPS0_9BACL|nr:acyltransferase [Planococcus koreensis]MBB5179385.1 acetyltransferase-like isoleucine patch superfamily enzyme [Planococcus koreensis]
MIKYYQKYLLKKAIKEGLQVGERTRILGMPNFGSEPYLIRIGRHCTITSGVKFITHDGATWLFRDEVEFKEVKRYGSIKIEDNCFIGVNSILMPNITIGENSVVAAGSLVNKDIPPNSVYGGVPAKFLMNLEQYKKTTKQKSIPNIPNGEKKKAALIEYFWGE